MQQSRARGTTKWVIAGGLAVVATAATACGGSSSSSSASSAAADAGSSASSAVSSGASSASSAAGAASNGKKYVVGVSNTLQGNGWREEMICSIKAQAKVSGQVSKLIVANKTEGTPQQIADIRNLISAGANIIIVDPSNPAALVPVIKQATAKGITVVSVDQGVDEKTAYNLQNDQYQYGKLGAEWLFKKMGGKGNVVEMRGIDGASADTDRHNGFQDALKAYPDIKVVKSVFTGWALATATKQIQDILNSGTKVDGVWTSGVDASIVDAFKTSGKPYVPIVGADNNRFISQLISTQGLVGAAVTNPAPVGGAGLALALKVKNGDKVEQSVKLTPEVWDQSDMAKLKSVVDPKLDPFYAVATDVKPWTTYTKADLIGCQGP
jgi:ribose transport system substrate-binding protein